MTHRITANPPYAAVLMDLREGYGVEDIALRRNMPVESIRRIITHLRDDGVLSAIDWTERVEV